MVPQFKGRANRRSWRKFLDAGYHLPVEGRINEFVPYSRIGWYMPSTGEHSPYFHLIFAMTDGWYIAFFDIRDGTGATVGEDMPS
jgi:hypothetical protein